MTLAAVKMELTGAGMGSVGGTNGFPLLRGSKSDAQGTILRKPRLWSQVVMAMA